MHRKIAGRIVNLVSLILGLAIALAGFLIQPVQAGHTNAIAVCAGQECTVTFEYSGAPYPWEPPTGATDIRFDLYGAQGGQGSSSSISGGLGGRVTGQLSATPTMLYVFVGGAGERGPGVPGGFNGGGYAGSGHGDEGSGGGATDLRTSADLADRVAVAGGGGGTGGFNWSNAGLGGAGGGLVGGDGGWGQAAPGLGGSKSSGGASGRSNGGAASEAGGLGIGGKGASSNFSGGGGGGGGYFGGGGGGADLDTCCFNGGGGGGGSSYAKPGSTASVQHSSGVRIGSGIAYITYHWEPVIPTPTPKPSVEPEVSPSAEPSSQPTSASTSSPAPSPESTQVTPPEVSPSPTPPVVPEPVPVVSEPVPVVEHRLPVVTVTPVNESQLVDTPSVAGAAPFAEPAVTSERDEASPAVVELVAHLTPPINAFAIEQGDSTVGIASTGSLANSDEDLEIPGLAYPTLSPSAISSSGAKLDHPPLIRAKEKTTSPIVWDWQVPVATVSLTVGVFVGWRKSRRKTPPQFVRIS